jgi:hypothetical protein
VPLSVVCDSYLGHYDYLGEKDREDFRNGEGRDVQRELKDWASRDMDWSDVEAHARMVLKPPSSDYQEGWINGDKIIVDVGAPEESK